MNEEKREAYSRTLGDLKEAALDLRSQNVPIVEIALRLGRHRSSVSRWFSTKQKTRVRSSSRDPRGRPSKLDSLLNKHSERFAKMLLSSPFEYGHRGALWTADKVAKSIQKEFKIDLSPASTYRLIVGLFGEYKSPSVKTFGESQPVQRVLEGLRGKEGAYRELARKHKSATIIVLSNDAQWLKIDKDPPTAASLFKQKRRLTLHQTKNSPTMEDLFCFTLLRDLRNKLYFVARGHRQITDLIRDEFEGNPTILIKDTRPLSFLKI